MPMRNIRSCIAAAVIALVAWIGLSTQFAATMTYYPSIFEASWAMLRYFTIIANLLVAVVFTAAALGLRSLSSPFMIGFSLVAILLVGVVYGLLLRGMIELSGGAYLADALNHKITPILVLLYWLFFASKGGLKPRDPLKWSALPVAYFAYALVRGSYDGTYAYPFLNPERIGWTGVAAYACAMAAGFMIAGMLLVWLDQTLARQGRP